MSVIDGSEDGHSSWLDAKEMIPNNAVSIIIDAKPLRSQIQEKELNEEQLEIFSIERMIEMVLNDEMETPLVDDIARLQYEALCYRCKEKSFAKKLKKTEIKVREYFKDYFEAAKVMKLKTLDGFRWLGKNSLILYYDNYEEASDVGELCVGRRIPCHLRDRTTASAFRLGKDGYDL